MLNKHNVVLMTSWVVVVAQTVSILSVLRIYKLMFQLFYVFRQSFSKCNVKCDVIHFFFEIIGPCYIPYIIINCYKKILPIGWKCYKFFIIEIKVEQNSNIHFCRDLHVLWYILKHCDVLKVLTILYINLNWIEIFVIHKCN